MSERSSIRVEIYGRVQGVWFRAWTEREARARGMGGWVRNRRDGSVEAVFSGSPSAVDEMIQVCWSGPPSAHVLDIVKETADFDGSGFEIRSTE
jgi:acylphosphatase